MTAKLPRLLPTLAITTAVQVAASATVLALTPIAIQAAAGYGVPPYWIGYQVSLIYLSSTFASATAGTLVRRHGAARVEVAALLTFALGLAGLAIGQLWLAGIASLLIGIGYGVNNPASSHMLNRITPRRQRNLVFSIKQSGVPLGGIVASLAMPSLSALMGWQASLWLGTLIPLALIAILLLNRHEWDEERDPHARLGRNFRAEQQLLWSRPKLGALSAIGMLYSATQLSLSAFTVLLLVQDAGWSIPQAGAAAALIQLFGACGRIGWGILADRTRGGFLILALLGAVACLCGIALVKVAILPSLAILIILCIFGACANGWNGVLLAETAEHSPPGQVGPVTGAVMLYTFIGVVVGPSLFTALLAHAGSYGGAYAWLGLASLGGAGIAGLMHRKQGQGAALDPFKAEP